MKGRGTRGSGRMSHRISRKGIDGPRLTPDRLRRDQEQGEGRCQSDRSDLDQVADLAGIGGFLMAVVMEKGRRPGRERQEGQ